MKKIFALMLAIVLLLPLLSGCVEDRPDDSSKQSSETNGVLRISTSPDFAPMVFVDPTQRGQDQFVGFDISLAKFIAAELNMELEIMPMDFNACQLAVYAGTVDMSISGYVWSESRAEQYNLSDSYLAGNSTDRQVLLTLASHPGRYATAEDFEGAIVGAQNTSLQQLLVAEQLPKAELDLFTNLDGAVRMLLAGEIDCLAVSGGNADALLAANPQLAETEFTFALDSRYLGNVILLRKGNDELTEQVNEILEKASQYYDTWYQEARSTAGIQVTYDENGNVVGTPQA